MPVCQTTTPRSSLGTRSGWRRRCTPSQMPSHNRMSNATHSLPFLQSHFLRRNRERCSCRENRKCIVTPALISNTHHLRCSGSPPFSDLTPAIFLYPYSPRPLLPDLYSPTTSGSLSLPHLVAPIFHNSQNPTNPATMYSVNLYCLIPDVLANVRAELVVVRRKEEVKEAKVLVWWVGGPGRGARRYRYGRGQVSGSRRVEWRGEGTGEKGRTVVSSWEF